jgi:hypothetical protein
MNLESKTCKRESSGQDSASKNVNCKYQNAEMMGYKATNATQLTPNFHRKIGLPYDNFEVNSPLNILPTL